MIYDVVDGDTIKVQAETERRTVRLIGIDSPETVQPQTPVECAGKEATDWMLRLTFPAPRDTDADGLVDDENAATGARVSLTTDSTQGLTDAFGRTLAYAEVVGAIPGNRTQPYDLGTEMLLAGWAYVYVFQRDFARIERYDDAAGDAEDDNRGAYALCDGDFHSASADE